MSRARAPPWQHPDGIDASRCAIEKCLKPHLKFFLDSALDIYPSTNFCVGIDNAKLAVAASALRDMLILDPRGGYLAQDDVAVGLGAIMESHLPTVLQKAFEQDPTVPPEDVIPTIAFKLRVMLAHTRLAHDNHKPVEGDTQPLQILFECMKYGKPTGDARSARRHLRPIKRQNRF